MAKRRSNPAIFIALADVMMCWAGRLYLEQNRDKIEIEIEIARLEEQKKVAQADAEQAQADAAQAQADADAERKRLEDETTQKKAALDARIADAESQLTQRQDDFQNWDLVVHRYLIKQYAPSEASASSSSSTPPPAPPPTVHLYARTDGVYRDGSDKKLSNDELRTWLIEQVPVADGAPHGRVVLALWQENGANDNYLRIERVVRDTKELNDKVYLDTIVLPDGVRADSSQTGN